MQTDRSIRDVMGWEYVAVSEGDSVSDAAKLLLDEGFDSAVVLRGTDPVGMFTARDALSVLVQSAEAMETPVGEVMSPLPPTVSVNDDLGEAEEHMLAEATGHLLVYDENDDIAGIVTERDLMAATASYSPEIQDELAVEAGSNSGFDAPENSEFENQSICEACGSLSRELVNVNGQLLCPDCREV